MNQVLVHAWNMFTLKGAPIIVNAFEKNHLYPLQLPKVVRDNTLVAAYTASMKCSS